MREDSVPLPKETGYYLWFRLDFGYFDVGVVQILQDTPEHLERLKKENKNSKEFYVYESGYQTFTMYHQAHDHLPPSDENNQPWVDGYIPFDFRTVVLQPLDANRIPKVIPRSEDERKLRRELGKQRLDALRASVNQHDYRSQLVSKFGVGDKLRVTPKFARLEGTVTDIKFDDGYHYRIAGHWIPENELEDDYYNS